VRETQRAEKFRQLQKTGIRGNGCSSMTKTFKQEGERRIDEAHFIPSLVNYHLLKCDGISA
jgi:hypothetical protein